MASLLAFTARTRWAGPGPPGPGNYEEMESGDGGGGGGGFEVSGPVPPPRSDQQTCRRAHGKKATQHGTAPGSRRRDHVHDGLGRGVGDGLGRCVDDRLLLGCGDKRGGAAREGVHAEGEAGDEEGVDNPPDAENACNREWGGAGEWVAVCESKESAVTAARQRKHFWRQLTRPQPTADRARWNK
jgi:hypothetical protein